MSSLGFLAPPNAWFPSDTNNTDDTDKKAAIDQVSLIFHSTIYNRSTKSKTYIHGHCATADLHLLFDRTYSHLAFSSVPHVQVTLFPFRILHSFRVFNMIRSGPFVSAVVGNLIIVHIMLEDLSSIGC